MGDSLSGLHSRPCCWTGAVAVFVLALLGLAAQPAEARKIDAGINIGYSSAFWSDTLQEQRRLFVYLPPHYEQAKELRYPVLYLLDAEEHFHHASGIVQFLTENERIAQMIVIGITNTERSRDLSPPTHSKKEKEEDPTSGGADAFLHFLSAELAPWVDAQFRTVPYRILVGHSFGGLFNMHALVSGPRSFQAHIAISPSLWWDEGRFALRARDALATLPGPHFLYLSWGDNEPTIRGPTEAFVAWLEKNPPPGLTWKSHYYQGDDHGTTPHRSLYDGLEALYDGWSLPYEVNGEERHYDVAAVEAHYAALSRKYGYTVPPGSGAIDSVGRDLLERKDYAAALGILQRNAADHPYLAKLHESLAEALEAAGRLHEALEEYRRALTLALDDETPYNSPISEYRKHVADVESQLKPKRRK